jgi:autotransporter passenger strand-loop-strand repeat protein
MTTVSSGQTSAVSSGSTSGGWIVLSGGTLDVLSGGVISGAVDSGGLDVVSAGGLALSTTISSGGTQYDYGTASGTIVSSGATDYVLGGTAIGTTVGSGAADYVFGGTAIGATISGGLLEAFGTELSGAVTFAGSNGRLAIDGATMPAAVISGFTSGDQIILDSVAFSSGATVSLTSGNVLKVVEGGSTYALQLDPAQTFSGTFHVGPSPFGPGDTTVELATITSVTSGQAVSSAVVGNANVQNVLSGGTAVSTTVNSGGEQDVQSGGTASAATLVGGVQVVYGFASATSVESVGLVDDFGNAVGIVVSNGSLEVNAGGTANATVVGSSGALYVLLGGTASNTVVSGFASVSGVAISTTLSGGFEEVYSGGKLQRQASR